MKKRRCRVQKYDPAVKEAPFEFITVDEFECCEPDMTEYGEEFAEVLILACRKMGYIFKCYSFSTEKGYDYDVVVYS